MSEEEQKELESRVMELLLETLGSSTGQDPLRIQEQVSAAVAESLKSKLQPLVEGANNKDVPPLRYWDPLEVGVPSPIQGDKHLSLTIEYYTAVYFLTIGRASCPRTERSLDRYL